jgi:hypothetical protein
MRSGKTRSFACGAALAAALAGCAGEEAELGGTSEEIIGGVALRSPKYNAIGAFAYPDGAGGFYASCTGTLITAQAVLTSNSCYTYPGGNFVIGPDIAAPVQVATVASVEYDPQGGGLTIVRLTAPVTGVTPIGVALLDESRLGERFMGVGYGIRNTDFESGTRRAGSMTFQGSNGLVFPMLFDSFENFLASAAGRYFPGVDVNDPGNQEWLRQFYEGWAIGINEAWFGGAAGDAQACYGDYGSPALLTTGGTASLYGVTSWFLPSTERLPCDDGAAYTAITPSSKDFIDYELACGGIPRDGVCEGTEVVRCATPEEGGYRPLRTDCGELGLICGVDEAGELGCVEDPCDGIAPEGQCEGDVAIRCSRPEEGPRRPLILDCSEILQTCGFEGGEVACVDPA